MFLINPQIQKKQAEYLYSFKYIDNKIKVLEKLSKHLKCEDEIKEIKNLTEKSDVNPIQETS